MFLGLDVGGTHCRCEWFPAGTVPGCEAPGVQPAVHGLEAAIAGLAEAIALATRTTSPTAVVAALAGVGESRTAEAIAAGLRARGVAVPVAVTGDVLAAAAAGLAAGPGVLIWSGTGSFAVARSRHGELHRTGGRGYLLGDQGSGYDLVRRAAAAVLLAIDDLGPATVLTETLTAAFRAPSPSRLGATLQQLDTAGVAQQLPVVLAAAADGDVVANDVLAAGVDGLAMLAAGALRRADLDGRDVPVAMGGGVLLAAPAIRELLSARLRSLGAAAPTVLDARAAARGAAWLAHGWHTHLEPQHTWVTRVAL